MATVNHVGEGMIGLTVNMVDIDGELMTGKVVKINKAYDFLYVTWATLPHMPELAYHCEKFYTKMVDDKLTLTLNLF